LVRGLLDPTASVRPPTYERLVAAGKPEMIALGAAMRKLLMITVGVLRSGKPFDPAWSEKVRQGRSEPARATT